MLAETPLNLRDRVRTDTDRTATIIGLYRRASVARLQFDSGDESMWSVRLLERLPSDQE